MEKKRRREGPTGTRGGRRQGTGRRRRGDGPDAPRVPSREPTDEHRWLQRLVGDWSFEGVAREEPGGPPETFLGTERVRPIGDLWIVAEAEGDVPGGGTARSLMTLGYDPRHGRFVGTWVGSTMEHLWVYDGTLDPVRRVLTLDTEGPDMNGGSGTLRYRDIVEIPTDDHRLLTARVLDRRGAWRELMTVSYRRSATQ